MSDALAGRPVLVWFRKDLRVQDHDVLLEALEDGDWILPVYCFDPRHFGEGMFGLPKTGPYRTRFLVESVDDLRRSLRERGGDLVVRTGRPEAVLPDLAERYEAVAVYTFGEVTTEELAVEDALMEALDPLGVRLELFWGRTLYHVADTPYVDEPVPSVYTKFRRSVERDATVRDPRPAPDAVNPLPDDLDPGEIPTPGELGIPEREPDPRGVLDFRGGERAGWDRIRAYIWEQDLLRHYKSTRNQLLGADYSSKFSPWLALGCVSARQIHAEVRRYEAERVQNKSTYWLIFELIWRDFFRYVGRDVGDRLFYPSGPQERDVDWRHDREAFERWAAGETGIPFVDANMRELNLTGWMSNRGRVNTASFLARNLMLDWRMGAAYFESVLIDYDVTSNWGNWAYQAGVGNDTRDRYVNFTDQAERYDPEGAFVKHWLPELADVPAEALRRLHRLSDDELRSYGITPGETVPRPMLDLEASYREIRERFRQDG